LKHKSLKGDNLRFLLDFCFSSQKFQIYWKLLKLLLFRDVHNSSDCAHFGNVKNL